MRQATLCILMNSSASTIILGYKKRGFGSGKYNGFGGKPKEHESILLCAVRELKEESGIDVKEKSLKKAAELMFTFPNHADWNQVVHVYLLTTWIGKPIETEEMKPELFSFSELPYDQMWDDDKYWLPLVLQGKKIRGHFTFSDDNSTVLHHQLEEVESF